MITQSINLNLITGQVLPRVNASQYDNNTRTLTMYLYDGELIFNIPNGVSGYIQGTKPDRIGFQYLATVTAGSNVVTFDITEQMTAVAGDVTCELVLVDGDDRIATVNFILHVEPAALSDDTVISETELPLIEEAAELGQQIGGFIEQMDADAAKSEAFGAGTVNGVPVTSDNPAYENNAKYYADEAAASASGVEQLKEDSEAYAVGTRDGVPVASGDPAYRNNSKFYANAASGSAATAVASETAAAGSEENAEAWAVGERDGEPVTSGDVTYHNNSKYYAGEAADSASNASTSETNAGLSETAAAQSEEDAEAWANGTRNGTPVASGDPAYHNNAKHWAEEASGTVSDMVGATASADGTHGLVPQPLMGDQNKVLTGGGTWAALGTAADKNSTNSVTQNSTDLVESGAVYTGLSGKAPTSHAAAAKTYGGATGTKYGHTKLSDSYTSSGGAAADSVGASSKAVYDAYTALNNGKEPKQSTTSTSVTDAGWGLTYVVDRVYKVGKIVSLNLTVTRAGGEDMIPNAYNICNLPAGYRPYANMYIPAKLYKSGDPDSQKLCTMEVLSDGSVKMGYGISTTGYDSFTLCTMFITS